MEKIIEEEEEKSTWYGIVGAILIIGLTIAGFIQCVLWTYGAWQNRDSIKIEELRQEIKDVELILNSHLNQSYQQIFKIDKCK